MSEEPMRRLPKTQIHATVEGMLDDLESEFHRVLAMRSERNRSPAAHNEFAIGMTKLRTLAEEILRWELL